MKNKNNTDSTIRGKLEGFTTSPPPHIWGNVQRQLAAQQQKKRRVYIGWISTAAAILLAFLAGWYFNENSIPGENVNAKNEIIRNEKSNAETKIQTEEINTKSTVEKSSNILNSEESKLIAASPASSKRNLIKPNVINENSYSRENIFISKMKSLNARFSQNQYSFKKLATKSEIIPENYLSENEKLLIAANIETLKSSENPDNNWKMGMYIAPGYSSYSASHTDSYSKNMTYSGSNGNSNVSGGLSIQYKTSKRWIVESGLYYAKNGQESESSANLFAQNFDAMYAPATGETSFFSNTVRVENNTLAMNSTAGVIQFSETPNGAEISGDFEALKSDVGNLLVPNGSFSQVFQFMEIPLFLRYRLVDSKLGVELITGINAGIVVGNNAYIDNQYGLQNIGETRDISPINVSGTVGVGLNYALGKHIGVALEPRFNYYLNSINTSSLVDYRPYRIGFYTGVSYEF